jgi:hypothetical protein
MICLRCFGQNNSNILIKQKDYKITLFESNYAFVNLQSKDTLYCYQTIFGKYSNSKPWTPKVSDVRFLEKNIKKQIEKYKIENIIDSSNNEDYNFILKNIDNYNRQYFCCQSKDGKKIIEIQFYFKQDDDNLNQPDMNIKSFLGGGARFFNIRYDFDKKEIIKLFINGPM